MAVFDNVKLAVFPSELVTRIFLVLLDNDEGEGGEGLLVSFADIYKKNTHTDTHNNILLQ